ncbi:MAG: winged helix-turn-helix transcriptional regulator [Clostridia bacterium]|nr:winged helix-turn-helix transcriptional regulator [Clostridia bacterium]
MDEIIKHLAIFVSRLWQIHAFGEGNTRTTAVFFIKYLHTLGFDVTNDIFAENAWYFRNALVRANYTNLKKDVHETTEYLELFLRNLLLDENNELKNRNLHISCTLEDPKCKNCTLDCTLEERAILVELESDSKITQKQIAEKIGKSERTVKTVMNSLEKKGVISREGGKRFGYWKVNV